MPQKNWLPALGEGPLGLRKRSGLRLQSPDLIPRPHYRDSQLFATGTLPRNGRSLNLRPKPPLSGIPKLPTTGEFVEMGNHYGRTSRTVDSESATESKLSRQSPLLPESDCTDSGARLGRRRDCAVFGVPQEFTGFLDGCLVGRIVS